MFHEHLKAAAAGASGIWGVNVAALRPVLGSESNSGRTVPGQPGLCSKAVSAASVATGIAPLRVKWRHIIPSAAKLGPFLREEFYGGLAFGVSSSHCFSVDRSLIIAFDVRELFVERGRGPTARNVADITTLLQA